MPFRDRGILFPARLPTFERVATPAAAVDLVSWFWIPRWDIAPGRTSRQHVLAFPAANLVVESASPEHPDGLIGLAGPTTTRSHRDLRGRGWAVGANLRPAALAAFTADPTALRDTYLELTGPGADPTGLGADSASTDRRPGDPTANLPTMHQLLFAVTAAMAENLSAAAVTAVVDWIVDRVGPVDEQGRLANAAADLLSTDPTVLHPAEAAERVAVSVRTLQRLTARYVGLSPAAMIRRRRLQEAAERVRRDPDIDLAALAADLGYSDHAHLTHEFRRVLAMPPSRYRSTH